MKQNSPSETFSIKRFKETAVAVAMIQAFTMDISLAATITVNNSLDGIDVAGCSFREAIASINGGQAVLGCVAIGEEFGISDTVSFDVSLMSNISEQILISSDVLINPNGSPIIFSGTGDDRIFFIQDSTVLIDNATISGGVATGNGGGISLFQSTVNLINSSVSENFATFLGGGIYASSNSTVALSNSLISNNTSDNDGGGVLVFDSSLISLENSSIIGNTGDFGGGVFVATDSSVTLNASSVLGNNSRNSGGGIVLFSDSSANLMNSTISNNSAVEDGGGISISLNSIVSLINSTVSDNSASRDGGGIIVSMNSDADTINKSTVTLSNSTISGNTADDDGGGFFIGPSNTLSLTNSTVSDNSAGDNGGGIFSSVSSISLSNNIISGNTALNSSEIVTIGGSVSLLGSNLLGESSKTNADAFDLTFSNNVITATSDGSQPTNLTSILFPLEDNGGLTFTHALVSGSPAIGTGDAAICATDPINNLDQRGEPRSVGSLCDIGAFEGERDVIGEEEATIYLIPLTNGRVVTFGL